jgi:hypothetical protein
MRKSAVFKKRLVSLFLVSFLFFALMIEYLPLAYATNYEQLIAGDFEIGNQTLTVSTKPWYTVQNSIGIAIINKPAGYGLAGNYSLSEQIQNSTPSVSFIVYQDIGFIPSGNVTDFYVYVIPDSWGHDFYAKLWVTYSDGLTDVATTGNLAGYGMTYKFEPSLSFLTAGKLITKIGIQCSGYAGLTGYFDNASFQANMNYERFTWTLVPTPASQTNTTFTGYFGQPYTFVGYFWNNSVMSNENGTFDVSSDYGLTTTGLIQSGSFSFNIPKRDYYGTLPPQPYSNNETFTIHTYLTSVTYGFQIIGSWTASGSYTAPSGAPSGQLTSQGQQQITLAVALIVPLLFLFLPALLLAEIAGIAGLIAGFCLGNTMLVVINWFPPWTLFFTGLAIVLLIFFGRSPHREE